MPKVVPWKDKERWYERYGLGDSVAKLSQESHKDPRTVQNGIDQVGNRRASQKAREGLFQEAHRLHQEDLLGSLVQVVRSVDSSSHHPGWEFFTEESSRSDNLGPIRVHRSEGAFDAVTIGGEDEFTWELLKEHLGRHEMFRQLDGWKRAFLAAMNAHMALRAEVVTVLDNLGLQVTNDLRGPGTSRPGVVEELSRAAVSRILAEDPPYGLRVDEGADGEFFIRGDTDEDDRGEFLVKSPNGGRLPPGTDNAPKMVSAVLGSVASGQAAGAIRETYNKADRASGEARRALELLRASHYVPGTCGACPRYGRV
jgi:hypothetical protein